MSAINDPDTDKFSMNKDGLRYVVVWQTALNVLWQVIILYNEYTRIPHKYSHIMCIGSVYTYWYLSIL